MASGVVERPAESRAVSEFLLSADRQPSGLVMEGTAGIGKTTLWLAGVAEARDRGFRVLSARAGQAETVLAYAALADLLGGVESAVLAELPRGSAHRRRPGAAASHRRRSVDRRVRRRRGVRLDHRPSVGGHAHPGGDRRCAVAGPVQPGRLGGRRPPVHGPGGPADHRANRARGGRRGDLAAAGPPRRYGSHARRPAEPGRTARAHLRTTRAVLSPPDDGADRRDLRRQPVLRARTGPRDRGGQLPVGAAGDTGRVDAAADRTSGRRNAGSAVGRGVCRHPHRRSRRPGHRQHRGTRRRVARGGEGQGHHRPRRGRDPVRPPLVGAKRVHRREAPCSAVRCTGRCRRR